jgi:1-deoxy-D-xylulose-5-phosphate synthase
VRLSKAAEESVHECLNGHSSNSISAAMGYDAARDLNGDDSSVVAVIGDGAEGGMAYEALKTQASSQSKMFVVINDNEMSISRL